MGEKVATSTVTGGAGADSIDFGALASSTKIVGGAGNDSFTFQSATSESGSTLYFGSSDGKDSIYFAAGATVSTVTGLVTIAVDSALGATSAYNFSQTSGASTATITFDTSGAGTIFLSGAVTAGTGGDGAGLQNFVFTTVSASTITDLG